MILMTNILDKITWRNAPSEQEQKKHSIEGVKTMLKMMTGRNQDRLPDVIIWEDNCLMKSSKDDGYYFVTSRGCSCPGYRYRGTCRHHRQYQTMR